MVNYLFLENYAHQKEPFLTMFYTINSSPLLVTSKFLCWQLIWVIFSKSVQCLQTIEWALQKKKTKVNDSNSLTMLSVFWGKNERGIIWYVVHYNFANKKKICRKIGSTLDRLINENSLCAVIRDMPKDKLGFESQIVVYGRQGLFCMRACWCVSVALSQDFVLGKAWST